MCYLCTIKHSDNTQKNKSLVRLSDEQIKNLPEWIVIPDYPKYEVNCRAGIIKSLYTGRLLKGSKGSSGYPQIALYRDGIRCPKMAHRIVAEAAYHHYGISTDGLFVMHLDEERHNPRIDNLALGTTKENLNFPKAKQRCSEVRSGEKNHMFGKHHSVEARKKIAEGVKRKHSKRVGAYKNGELIMVFQSTQEAGRNGFIQNNVSACCRGKYKSHKGYQWRYFDTPTAMIV